MALGVNDKTPPPPRKSGNINCLRKQSDNYPKMILKSSLFDYLAEACRLYQYNSANIK